MYAQIFLVTSVRGAFLTPQTFAKASDRVFGAKMPLPAFFIPLAFAAVLPAARFAAVIFFNSALVIVVFFVVVVGTVVFVVVVMAVKG